MASETQPKPKPETKQKSKTDLVSIAAKLLKMTYKLESSRGSSVGEVPTVSSDSNK